MGRSREELAEETGVPVENFHPTEPGRHMEILDTQTMQVWQTMANVTQEEYDALAVEEPFRKVGLGGLSAYCSFFRQSPNAEMPGAMRTREYGGHLWSFCAMPMGAPSLPAGPDGPRLMQVNKHHSIVYAGGGELRCLESPEGAIHVPVVGEHPEKLELPIPEGWSFREVSIEAETIVHLPCPTHAFFFQTERGMVSYQGPVSSLG